MERVASACLSALGLEGWMLADDTCSKEGKKKTRNVRMNTEGPCILALDLGRYRIK